MLDDFLKMPETRYLDPDDRILWKSSSYVQRNGDLSARLAFLKVFCKALADAGVPLLTGTDTPSIPGLVPGFSLHQDLHALEEAGLSRYQVLSAATREPGELIARAKQSARTFGTVTVGERADFILSAANPLDDLSTLAKPLGVMTGGHWYDQSEYNPCLTKWRRGTKDRTRSPTSHDLQLTIIAFSLITCHLSLLIIIPLMPNMLGLRSCYDKVGRLIYFE